MAPNKAYHSGERAKDLISHPETYIEPQFLWRNRGFSRPYVSLITHLSDKQRAANIVKSLSPAIMSALLLDVGEVKASAAAAWRVLFVRLATIAADA